MISVIKFVLVFIVGIFLCFLLLLDSRDVLCDDIKESTGRNVFRNKRKKNKKYPNRIKWFFLWGHIYQIRKWRYTFFIIQIPFGIATVVVIAMMAAQGINPFLRVMFIVSVIPVVITKLFLLSVPWGRYRP